MLLTVSRAAKILELSEAAVRGLERRGELLASHRRLFDQSVVERIARERVTQRLVAPSSEAV